MENKTPGKNELINLIVDKAVSMMEDALKSNEKALLWRDFLSSFYDTGNERREQLFREFYQKFNNFYGKDLDESKFSDPDYDFPFLLDCEMSDSIASHISKIKKQKFEELQDKLWDWLLKMITMKNSLTFMKYCSPGFIMTSTTYAD